VDRAGRPQSPTPTHTHSCSEKTFALTLEAVFALEEMKDGTGDRSGNTSSSMLSMVMLRAGVAALRAAGAAALITGAGSGDGDLTAAATGAGADATAEETTAGLAFATPRMGGCDGCFLSDDAGEEAVGEELRGLRLASLEGSGGDGSVGRSPD
jgi:hypothetical protein